VFRHGKNTREQKAVIPLARHSSRCFARFPGFLWMAQNRALFLPHLILLSSRLTPPSSFSPSNTANCTYILQQVMLLDLETNKLFKIRAKKVDHRAIILTFTQPCAFFTRKLISHNLT
jgi:hypothetical protein